MSSSGWRLRVGVESFAPATIWRDNYVDLLPGESRLLELERGDMPELLWLVAGMGERAVLPETGAVQL
jgi:hypothetical protein